MVNCSPKAEATTAGRDAQKTTPPTAAPFRCRIHSCQSAEPCCSPWRLRCSSMGSRARIFNTVKQKLAAGKQVVGGTVSVPDPDTYCAMANSGFDFLWIEMQHSPMSFQDVAHMIMSCKGAPAMPFIRVPDATEGDIQKAVDMGAAGIIIPMVENLDKVRNAIKFAKYPPLGKRSQGGGQYGALWGPDYRQIANDNIMIVAMIESPAGVALAEEMASTPGVDVIFAASTDLSSFSGYKQGDPTIRSACYQDPRRNVEGRQETRRPAGLESNAPGIHILPGPRRNCPYPKRSESRTRRRGK